MGQVEPGQVQFVVGIAAAGEEAPKVAFIEVGQGSLVYRERGTGGRRRRIVDAERSRKQPGLGIENLPALAEQADALGAADDQPDGGEQKEKVADHENRQQAADHHE